MASEGLIDPSEKANEGYANAQDPWASHMALGFESLI